MPQATATTRSVARCGGAHLINRKAEVPLDRLNKRFNVGDDLVLAHYLVLRALIGFLHLHPGIGVSAGHGSCFVRILPLIVLVAATILPPQSNIAR